LENRNNNNNKGNMVYFLDKVYNKNERLTKILQVSFGVGLSVASLLCIKCGVTINASIGDLDNNRLRLLTKELRLGYELDNVLYLKIKRDLLLKRKILSYQGIRLKRGLPVRGQRSHTNAMSVRKLKIQEI